MPRLLKPGWAATAGLAVVLAGATVAAQQARADRAAAVAAQRYDVWLGAAPAADSAAIQITSPWWASPLSMEVESQVAFELARRRLSPIASGALVDGLAWHLQSRVVEELFDYAAHQPGHHAEELRLFGGCVRWGIPLLVLPRDARDDRPPMAIGRAADAVATLEGVVGWPALAGALRVIASDQRPTLNRDAVKAVMESALGVPLDWFIEALDPDFTVNYSLRSVAIRPEQCDGVPCFETAVTVARQGPALLAVPIAIEFGAERRSTITWSGAEGEKVFTFRSGLAPTAVTLDPERRMRLDSNRLDQRWVAGPASPARPVKMLASWMIWLQNAVLTYDVLL